MVRIPRISLFNCMNRDSNFEEANVRIMANELDRLLEKYKNVLNWHDRLDAAGLVNIHYGKQLLALDTMFSKSIPKHPEIMSDPKIRALANRFIEFGDRYNKGDKAGEKFDVRSFQGASLNEMRHKIRGIIKSIIKT